MKNGFARYYKSWNSAPGDNYYIFDRTTGLKIFSCNPLEEAENKVRELNEKDRQEKGLPPSDEVQTPASYCGTRNREVTSVSPMPIYK